MKNRHVNGGYEQGVGAGLEQLPGVVASIRQREAT
jgi:hypothetical protein